MDVSFVVPVYNHLDLTKACLDSLQETVAEVDYEVIVVNDGSEADCAEGLRRLASDRVRVVESPVNQGYAHANNLGTLQARGEILFLLNNDLEFLPGWLSPMLQAFRRKPNLGIVGNVQRRFATGEIDHCAAYVSATGTIEHRRNENRSLGRLPRYTRCHLVTGACCAIRRDLFLQLGGYDEAFVNGGEDVDLCFRLTRLGYQVVVANKSVALHHVSATRKETSSNDEWNSRLLQRRWGDRIASMSASRWPDRYLQEAFATSHPRALDRKLLAQALSRFLLLRRGPAPAALYQAYCEQERNERNWKALLDGWTDDMIKEHERSSHATPLKDRYEYNGLYSDAHHALGVWIRDTATLSMPRGSLVSSLTITGELYEANPAVPEEAGKIGIALAVNKTAASAKYPIDPGPFALHFDKIPVRAQDNTELELKLLGVERSNAYAYLGRVLSGVPLLPSRIRNYFGKFRAQRLNKRLAIHSIQVNGEDVFNFAKDSTNPLNTEYVLRHAHLGINLVGWFKAELGIGESARLAAKALKASGLPHSIVPLRVNCLASQGDLSLVDEFSAANPHPINVFHIDAPQSPDIDHYHGKRFREGKYNIAYWAWELPDFPDHWTQHFRYFDEIWTPSNFVREAISIKSPLPVITVPHCIDFSIPERDYRTELGLPSDKFLFSFAYDLNSYQERKNPKAAIEAFVSAFAGSDRANDVGLVIKIHSTQRNSDSYRELVELLRDVPNYYLIDQTLSREMTYGLMKACDCYLSLHRAEGFGLTLAESMFLEKPVVSTNWSATSEFVNASNGCPVAFKLVPLQKDFGPYKKGQVWADPDTQDAARHMRHLVNNPEQASTLGKRAKQTIIDLYSPARIGDLYRKRLRSIALW